MTAEKRIDADEDAAHRVAGIGCRRRASIAGAQELPAVEELVLPRLGVDAAALHLAGEKHEGGKRDKEELDDEKKTGA